MKAIAPEKKEEEKWVIFFSPTRVCAMFSVEKQVFKQLSSILLRAVPTRIDTIPYRMHAGAMNRSMKKYLSVKFVC